MTQINDDRPGQQHGGAHDTAGLAPKRKKNGKLFYLGLVLLGGLAWLEVHPRAPDTPPVVTPPVVPTFAYPYNGSLWHDNCIGSVILRLSGSRPDYKQMSAIVCEAARMVTGGYQSSGDVLDAAETIGASPGFGGTAADLAQLVRDAQALDAMMGKNR